MLKEVGASGQISLGKRFAGRLFEVVIHKADCFELSPMKAVPQGRPSAILLGRASSTGGWLPPGSYTQCSQWALDNSEALTICAQQIGGGRQLRSSLKSTWHKSRLIKDKANQRPPMPRFDICKNPNPEGSHAFYLDIQSGLVTTAACWCMVLRTTNTGNQS